jgi:transmembrane sensor
MWFVGSVHARENSPKGRKRVFRTMAATDQAELRRREAHEWIVRLTSGQATAADALAAKLWCCRSSEHARAFAEATLLWETLEPVAQQVASQVSKTILEGARARLGRRALLGGAVGVCAAAVALIIWPPFELWPSLSDLAADYRTRIGERSNIAINGISVELNTRSSLNVLSANGAVRRLELVAGEAIFTSDGAMPVPLVLAAGGGQVSATGAKFDVRCEGAVASVICLQGAVKIDFRGDRATLQEGQQIDYGARGLGSALPVDPVVATAWRDGRLVFHDTPLSRVIEEVNRYRSGRIVLMNEALGKRSVEVTLPLDQTDELIVLLREAYRVKITTLPGGIILLT